MTNEFILIYLFLILLYGLIKKVNVFNAFIQGVKESFSLVLTLFPTMVAFILFTTLFESSGLQAFMISMLSPILSLMHIPECLVMMIVLRPLSGSGSLVYLDSLYRLYGVDHLYSFIATLIQSGSDTTLYVLSFYFSSVSISKTRYALPLGLFLDFIAIFFAFLIASLIY